MAPRLHSLRYPEKRPRLLVQGLLAIGAIGLIGLPACTPDPPFIPVRNLERPSDLAFACVERVGPKEGEPGPTFVTARPSSVCHDPDPAGFKFEPGTTKLDPKSARGWKAPETFGSFGLLTNTSRGEVAIVDFDRDRLLDVDTGAPGFNHVPVGSLPEAIAVSRDGCTAVTANHGTCDLSAIDVSGLLARRFNVPAVTAEMRVPVAAGVRIKSGGIDLQAQPGEIAFLPKATVAANCAVGAMPGMGPPSEVVVTFPRCGLVAVVALPAGNITSSVRILSDGSVVNAGVDPVCPIECGAGSTRDAGDPPLPSDAGSPDAAVADAPGIDDAAASDALDGGTLDPDAATPADAALAPPVMLGPANPALPPASARAVLAGLAIRPDATQLFVGVAGAPLVVSVGLAADPTTGAYQLVPAGAGGKITLSEGATGVSRVRLSVDPFANATGGRFVGTGEQFLYAFARDGSVRVLDVRGNSPTAWQECDANVDLIGSGMTARRQQGCIPVRENLPRRLLSQGPGIRVPVTLQPDVAPAVPIDIAFAESEELATGFLLASNGQVYHLGLGIAGFDFRSVEKPLPMDNRTPAIHSFRRAPSGFTPRSGAAAVVSTEPVRNFTSTDVGYPTKVGFATPAAGPRAESFQGTIFTSGSSAAGQAATVWAYFPREQLAPGEVVSVEWQGVLPSAARISGHLELPNGAPGNAGALTDIGANFCRAGVQTGDIVALVGCEQDLNCDELRQEVCHQAAPGAPGVCIPRTLAADEARLRACRTEFSSRRRYEVKEASATRLVLGVKLDEVPRPAVAACDVTSDSVNCVPDGLGQNSCVCQPDLGHRADPRILGDRNFSCQQLREGRPRCVKTCGVLEGGVMRPDDGLCRPGHVCADVGEATPLCVEAPPPKQECLTGELRYRVQVGAAYRVHSTSLPDFATQMEETPGGRCVPIPNLDWRLSNRIPLNASVCSVVPAADTTTGDFIRANEPRTATGPRNPCMFVSPNGDESGAMPRARVKALFENPNLRFVLTNIEDYVGDVALIEMSVTEGFSPLRVLATRSGSDVALGVRIVTGPMAADFAASSLEPPVPPYLFVIDQGRTTSELSRGQLLRLNPRAWSELPAPGGFFDSLSTNTLYPIQ